MKTGLYILLTAMLTGQYVPASGSQDGDLRCLSVNPNGSVQLHWLAATDSCGDFQRYEIYRATALPGPYTLVAQVPAYGTVTYNDAGANGQTSDYYYFMVTVSACGAFTSDTLRPIRLQLSNTGGGIAILSWNAPSAPLPVSVIPLYYVYREYPPGTWTLIDSTVMNNFTDTVSICNALINYRIELRDSSGCSFISSVDGDVFQDVTGPGMIELDSVSVDTASGNALLGWPKSTSSDAVGYIVYKFVGGFWQPVDTLWGRDSTFFMNTGGGAGGTGEEYRVAAFDSCFNVSPLSIKHNTIFLSVSIDQCTLESTLSWNAYVNWTAGVAWYEVYVIENGGAPNPLGSVNTFNYTHSGLNPYSSYCYVIRAVDGTGTRTSSSNKVCVYANPPQPPAFDYVSSASVSGNGIDLRFYVDTAADAKEYRLLRAPVSAGPYTYLATLPVTGLPLVTYTDGSADPSAQTYAYKLQVVDSCGAVVFLSSNYGLTILCSVTANSDYTNTLAWTPYEDWPGGVSAYNIYRSDGGPGSMVLLTTVGANVYTYTDDVSGLVSGNGAFCYQVEAVEAGGNPWPYAERSFSNVVCAYQLPRLFIPNAFTPNQDGINDVFTPISIFIDPLEYSFLVFNRWSDVVFETNDPFSGWDGNYNNNPQPEGVYVFFVRIKTVDGRTFDKKGTFSLIR